MFNSLSSEKNRMEPGGGVMEGELDQMVLQPRPTRTRPLLGLTVLVVEDSRYASEALRLMCLRSGARIRRADCVASAKRHLNVYRPSVAIIDLGLPDGSGLDLIRTMQSAKARVPILLGTSGAEQEASAAACAKAGADGFLPKPMFRRSRHSKTRSSNICPTRCGRRGRAMRSKGSRPIPSPCGRTCPTRWNCCRSTARHWATCAAS
jgi:CheY-like chemotaxis protein